MNTDEYYREKVQEINEQWRTTQHPANNHKQRDEPSEEQLQLLRQFRLPDVSEVPLIIFGWQYCKSCFNMIARVVCEDCFLGKDKGSKCTHLTMQPQADPSREMCDWCYYQFIRRATRRRRKAQGEQRCEKCQKVTDFRVLTYQDDTFIIICKECQLERIQALESEIFTAYTFGMERDLYADAEGDSF